MNAGRFAILLLMLCAASTAYCRAWSAKPLRIVVNYPSSIGAQELILAPDAFAARLRAEHERMGTLVRETGLRVE